MATVAAGQIVAEKYRVERLLGSGGMGYVVAARHLDLGQLVAIKFLSKGAVEDGEALARFRREAKAASRLRNEHVATVHDVGVHDNDEPFIVMEYLDGADLGAVAKQRGALAVSEACEYLMQACEALAEAHALGIVHRDVKLANLFLTKTASGWPLVKVLDFGVSKTIGRAEAQGDVTRTAAMLGSPKYMSPEQMNDPRTVDARTDVWSLGVCLYRLTTGKPPFEGDTIGRLCTAVLHQEPAPVSALRPEIPPAFAAAVARCLEKDRGRRFANVAEVAAAIAPFAVDPERAYLTIARIANVLGVPPPPMGFMPALPPAVARGSAGTGENGAWTATYGSPEPPPRTRRPEIMLGAAIATMIAALAVAGVVLFRSPRPAPPQAIAAATAASAAPAPAPPPPPPPLPIAVATAEPVAAAPPPSVTTAPPPAPVTTVRRRTTTSTHASRGNASETFPSDRK